MISRFVTAACAILLIQAVAGLNPVQATPLSVGDGVVSAIKKGLNGAKGIGRHLGKIKSPPFPRSYHPPGRRVFISNSHQAGYLGDGLTAQRLTGMGYQKLRCRERVQGIDGIYTKEVNGQARIVVVENKLMRSGLTGEEMTDNWVIGHAKKLANSDDVELSKTGKLLLQAFDKGAIEKQLWRHNIETGRTRVTLLDENAKYIGKKWQWDDRMIPNVIESMCEKKTLVCEGGY